jgi:hypothetical protein
MTTENYAIQLVTRSNNYRSELIYGSPGFLADMLQSSVDNENHKLDPEDLVIVILETDDDGNSLSKFSRKPIVTVDTFIDLMTKESKNV